VVILISLFSPSLNSKESRSIMYLIDDLVKNSISTNDEQPGTCPEGNL
jgi:hypothetical protein